VNYICITFGLYAVGFLLAPKVLIDMNFNAGVDGYHEFLSRFSGWTMCVLCWALYTQMATNTALKVGLIWSIGCALLGPTFAGFYLSPKQTPEGHMPAHVLFLAGGILALLTTM
jgi:hypothetical protein